MEKNDQNCVYVNLPNRLYRISEKPLIGLLDLLSLHSIDLATFIYDIGKYELESNKDKMSTKEYFISRLSEYGIIDYESKNSKYPTIAAFFDNMYNPIFLDSVIRTFTKMYYESKPVSANNLYASVREILYNMEIKVDREILYDRFFAVYITSKNNPDVPISYMHQTFEWSNSIGSNVMQYVLDRKTFPSSEGFYVIFEVDSHDDKVIIDTAPDKYTSPIYIEGTPQAKTKVSAFINELRNRRLGVVNDKDKQEIDATKSASN